MIHASLAVTGLDGNFKSVSGNGLPDVAYIRAPYTYRSPFQEDENNMATHQQGLEIINWTTTGRPAAVILEVALHQWCNENGTLMNVDEAQSGVGRTGKWFAIEHFGVVPDIITTSKSLGGGVPLCGVTTAPEIADKVAELGYCQSSSHADDPFLTAVGLANIEILEREGLVQNADLMGKCLHADFLKMKNEFEIVSDVRGLGLTIGIEIVVDKINKTPSPEHATAISSFCGDHDLLLGHRPTGAVSGSVTRVLPPRILNTHDADAALSISEMLWCMFETT